MGNDSVMKLLHHVFDRDHLCVVLVGCLSLSHRRTWRLGDSRHGQKGKSTESKIIQFHHDRSLVRSVNCVHLRPTICVAISANASEVSSDLLKGVRLRAVSEQPGSS